MIGVLTDFRVGLAGMEELGPEVLSGLLAQHAFSDAIYRKSTLPLREFEAARITVADVNQCRICLNLRPEGGPDQAFYDAVRGSAAGLTEREALAAEFARRFAADHLGMDDAFWARLHAAFSDDELVELGLCTGSWLAFGRLNQVLRRRRCLPYPARPARARPGGAPRLDGLGGGLGGGRRVERAELVRVAG